MKKAAIIGATGFGGLGLIEILLRHPEMEITQLVARKDIGLTIDEVFPHLSGLCNLTILGLDELDYSEIDIAFFSTPDRAGMTIIEGFYDRGIPVIDFSGDFRFKTIEEYSAYAKFKGMDDNHESPHILESSVYGVPEIYSKEIKKAKVVGNPGCFAVSMILGLLPVINEGIVNSDTLICDGKTGVSGAGKNPGETNFYPQRYENVNTYREGKHQHLIEVENTLNAIGKKDKKVLFIPQIVPLNRGILTTMYGEIKNGIDTKQLVDLYNEFYRGKPFIIITDKSPNTADVRGSNRCVIRPVVDERTGKLFITSAIDNLLKGQSGNAIQCANIMLGFNETTGLSDIAFYP